MFLAGRCHPRRRCDFWRINSARPPQRHDRVHENHLRAAQDTPERFQKDLGRKYESIANSSYSGP